jgi:hypothetical protein
MFGILTTYETFPLRRAMQGGCLFSFIFKKKVLIDATICGERTDKDSTGRNLLTVQTGENWLPYHSLSNRCDLSHFRRSIIHSFISSQLQLAPGGPDDPNGIPAFLSKAMTPPHS